jgi:hypothetical protein
VGIMDFLELQSGRKRSAVFHLSYDMHRGKGSVSDGAAFSVAFLGVAYYFGWLPSLWSASRRGRVRSLVMPVFIVLVLSYFYLTFKTYYIQPWATALCFAAQLGVLVYLSART